MQLCQTYRIYADSMLTPLRGCMVKTETEKVKKQPAGDDFKTDWLLFCCFYQENCLLKQLPEPCIVLQRDCNIPGSVAAGLRSVAVVMECRCEDRAVPVGNILVSEGI